MNIRHLLINQIPDSIYLRLIYRKIVGKKLFLRHPQTFNEKLQWLKIHDRNPAYTELVDKYAVRDFVKRTIGKQYLIPLLGVWDSFDQIDFNALPNQFVLKTNHDSGSVVICRDKSSFDKESAQKILTSSLKRNYYYQFREWPYKNVKRRILAEQFMTDSEGSDNLTDYKFSCFNGRVDNVMTCLDRNSGDTKFLFFDHTWTLRRYNLRGKSVPEGFTIPKPECMDEMFSLAAKLSKGIPFVRVDLYAINGKPFFGELTFYPQSGFDRNLLPETDKHFGELLDLSILQR